MLSYKANNIETDIAQHNIGTNLNPYFPIGAEVFHACCTRKLNLFNFDFCTGAFELSLECISFFFAHAFFNSFRSTVN